MESELGSRIAAGNFSILLAVAGRNLAVANHQDGLVPACKWKRQQKKRIKNSPSKSLLLK
jgi:hypothetical protein